MSLRHPVRLSMQVATYSEVNPTSSYSRRIFWKDPCIILYGSKHGAYILKWALHYIILGGICAWGFARGFSALIVRGTSTLLNIMQQMSSTLYHSRWDMRMWFCPHCLVVRGTSTLSNIMRQMSSTLYHSRWDMRRGFWRQHCLIVRGTSTNVDDFKYNAANELYTTF